MALIEFECPSCKVRIEQIRFGSAIDDPAPVCHECGVRITERVEFSVPAKRSPEHGIQR